MIAWIVPLLIWDVSRSFTANKTTLAWSPYTLRKKILERIFGQNQNQRIWSVRDQILLEK